MIVLMLFGVYEFTSSILVVRYSIQSSEVQN